MNEKVLPFKPEPVYLELGETKYELLFDLNAFCEMEKLYDSVDNVLAMLINPPEPVQLNEVTYNGVRCLADDIQISGTPLSEYILKIDGPVKAKHSDTLNLLWLACLHNHTQYDEDGNVLKYTISKAQLGKQVTFGNLKEVNNQIVAAILRDLLPAIVAEAESKNAQAASTEQVE